MLVYVALERESAFVAREFFQEQLLVSTETTTIAVKTVTLSTHKSGDSRDTKNLFEPMVVSVGAAKRLN